MGISYYEKAGINTVPAFLKAKSAKGLQRIMLLNNQRHKGFVVYQDIQWNATDRSWYAWYYVTKDREEVDKTLSGSD